MTLPSTFKHIAVNEHSRAMTLAESPLTQPEGRNILIHVCAAGVNRADILQQQGLYPPPADASPILGLEVSGTVAAIGPEVSQWAVGDRVCALTHGGGYADYCAIREDQCFSVPPSVALDQAAGLPEALLTAWHNIFERGQLKPNETLLIQGGASGIGSIAVQMAKLWGATVIATAGGDEKCNQVAALGADTVINYREQDFVAVINEVTNHRGVDVVLDMIGGDYIQKHIQIAALDGRIVNIAYQNGFSTPIDFLGVLLKRLTLSASTLRPQSFDRKASMIRAISEHFGRAIETGQLVPVIDSQFSLAQASDAHAALLAGHHVGKLLLYPQGNETE